MDILLVVKSKKDIPIIMLSARGEEIDKLNGFDIGIDDYITKLFSPKDLIARIKAVSKRNSIGTGVGLSIVKDIFENHNLNYGVNSKSGEGTTFYFEINKLK